MIELVYETHSITTDNEAGLATGWLPGELSERGLEAARALGERRRHDGIELVFTSDLRRAVETAEIAFAGASLPVVQDRRLRECDYGELNGHPVAEVDAERLCRVDTPFPGGESYRDVVERTRSFLADLERKAPARVLVIAHSANRWAIEHLLDGTPLEELVAGPFAWQEGWVYRLDGTRFAQG
jgi:broad specificity phosphatase PhoE